MNDHGITNKYLEEVVRVVANTEMVDIAKALLAERDERKKVQDVWKDAPEWATVAKVHYRAKDGGIDPAYIEHTYTRTLPKTWEREIAEEIAHTIIFSMSPVGENQIADTVEAGIKKYAEGEKNV